MSNSKSVKDLINGCSVILLDIEGVTTSIDFVKKILFPLAQKNVGEYLEETWDCDETKEIVNALFAEYLTDTSNEIPNIVSINKELKMAILMKFISSLIKTDRKLTPLKKLQGYIWKKAYECGDVIGHVYDDVKPMLKIWKEQNLPVYIYSSGSIEAQKLLFRYSEGGNLLEYFSGHYDTTIGHKVDSMSYTNIANDIGIFAESIVFITDLPKEAEAARRAKMKVIISKRPGTVLYNQEVKEFVSISSFNQLK